MVAPLKETQRLKRLRSHPVSDARKAAQLVKESPINPKTGRVWTLADAELKTGVDATQKRLLKDRDSALRYLRDAGFITPTGRLSKKYGG
jgi:hypothetical protein